jgi:hypothetical protein
VYIIHPNETKRMATIRGHSMESGMVSNLETNPFSFEVQITSGITILVGQYPACTALQMMRAGIMDRFSSKHCQEQNQYDNDFDQYDY